MRIKSEGKRRDIVAAAAALFVELGYERTSMSAISARVGGSKATLYSHFESKEDLLRAVLADSVAEEAERLMREFPEGQDLGAGLAQLGYDYLSGRLSPLQIAILRILSAQPEGARMGGEFHEAALKPAWQDFAARLAGLMANGRLIEADPWTAAMHWKGLNEGELLERCLLGADPAPDDAEIRQVAHAAAGAFLRIYGADRDSC